MGCSASKIPEVIDSSISDDNQLTQEELESSNGQSLSLTNQIQITNNDFPPINQRILTNDQQQDQQTSSSQIINSEEIEEIKSEVQNQQHLDNSLSDINVNQDETSILYDNNQIDVSDYNTIYFFNSNISVCPSFENEFFCLSKEEKVSYISKLVVSLQFSNNNTDISFILQKVLSFLYFEHDPYILYLFHKLIKEKNLLSSLLKYLYLRQEDANDVLSILHILLFFYLHNTEESYIQAFISNKGIPLVLSILSKYSDKTQLISVIPCNIFALLYVFSFNYDFCSEFIKSGGLSVFHDCLEVIADFITINSSSIINEIVNNSKSNSHFSIIITILTYIISILSSLSSYDEFIYRITTLSFISYDIRIQQQIVQIITNIWNIKTIVDFSYEISTMEGIRLQAVLSSLSQPETFTSQLEAFYFHDLLFVYQLITCFYDSSLLTKGSQLSFIKENGLNSFSYLFSIQPSVPLSSLIQPLLSLLSQLIQLNLLPSSIFSSSPITTLLLQICHFLINSSDLITLPISQQQEYLQITIQLITSLTSHCSLLRSQIDISSLLSLFTFILDSYDNHSFFSILLECLLAVCNVNESNLEIISRSVFIDNIFPMFWSYIDDQDITCKITTLLSVFTNYYGFDKFFENSTIIPLLKEIVLKYQENAVILQNCLLTIYYLSHSDHIIREIDDELFSVLSHFVKLNEHDQGVTSRFQKICESMGM